MRKLLLYTIIFIASLCACEDIDNYSSNASHKLLFSQDTLILDTTFTNIPTSTYRLMVYNPHKDNLLISSIHLSNAKNSGFRINVDGVNGVSFTDIEIAAKDSMHIFVEATFPKQPNDAINLIKDSILFSLNGTQQEIKLRAYTQNASVWRGMTIEQDTFITDERPLLIYDSLIIAPQACLSLSAGTRLYFHNKATMKVEGILIAEGTINNPIIFRGDRTDYLFSELPYDRLPGQWGGLHFTSTSYHNILQHTDIHSATFGIRCDSSDITQNKLILEHSSIHQVSKNGLELIHCQATIGNSEICNAGENCVFLQGGNYTFIHCTIANLYSWNIRQGYALRLCNAEAGVNYPLHKAEFRNCLITGSSNDEVSYIRSSDENIDYNYYFSHCLIHSTATDENRFVNIIWQQDNNFVLADEQKQLYDFRLTNNSKAIDIGDTSDAASYPTDKNGVPRTQNRIPDAGCYENDKS